MAFEHLFVREREISKNKIFNLTDKDRLTLKVKHMHITQGELTPSSFWRSLSLFGTTQICLSAKEFMKLKWQKYHSQKGKVGL